MKLEFSGLILAKLSNIKFHQNLSSVFLCSQTNRRTNMTKLIVTFGNFANGPKSDSTYDYEPHLTISVFLSLVSNMEQENDLHSCSRSRHLQDLNLP
jgi:hypothetical protein